jgi:hypothetical protein
VFIALGFVNHPNGLWGDLFRLVGGLSPTPALGRIAGSTAAFGMVAWFTGAAIETALISLGLRLTHPPDQAADYDDLGPPNA